MLYIIIHQALVEFSKFHLMCITNIQLAELQLAIINKFFKKLLLCLIHKELFLCLNGNGHFIIINKYKMLANE